jgi:mRNA interferase MazF
MRRGEIWWADMGLPSGRRPVMLLSRDDSYEVRTLVIIAPITTRIRGIHSEVLLDIDDGLPRKCVINLDNMTTILKSKLQNRITTLSPKKLKEAEEALLFAVDIEI